MLSQSLTHLASLPEINLITQHDRASLGAEVPIGLHDAQRLQMTDIVLESVVKVRSGQAKSHSD